MSLKTIPELLENRVKEFRSRLLFQRRDGWSWKQITWLDFDREVKNISAYMFDLGLNSGDRSIFASSTRIESVTAQTAVYMLGGVIVPVSPEESAENFVKAVNALDVKFIFLENVSQLNSILSVWDKFSSVEKILLLSNDRPGDKRVVNFQEIVKFGLMKKKKLLDTITEISQAIDPDSTCTIFINSTDVNDGIKEVSHVDLLDVLESISAKISVIGDEDQAFSFMSAATPFSQFVNFVTIYRANRAVFAESREEFIGDILEVKPTVLFDTKDGIESLYAKSTSSGDGLTAANKLKRDLGSRLNYLYVDEMPGSAVEQLLKESGVKIIQIDEFNKMLS